MYRKAFPGTNRVVRAAVVQAEPPPPGGDEFDGLTPTHYVAPAANVSGATNDDSDMGASAWAAASNPLTPTTIGTALRRASAGNIVGISEGVYTRTIAQSSATSSIPCFNPTNSGTSGNPITFVGKYCPTKSATTSGQRTELRNGVTVASGDVGAPTFGSTGRNYITWVNIYCDLAQSCGNPGVSVDGAMATLSGTGSVGGVIRGCFFQGTEDFYDGTNFSGVKFEGGNNMLLENCIFDGITDSGNQNCACFHMFTTHTNTVRHNIFRNSNTAAYIKFDHGGTGMYGIVVEYNHVYNMAIHAFKIGDPSTVLSTLNYLRHNLIVNSLTGFNPAFANNNADGPKNWRIHNNTVVDCDYFIYVYSGVQSGAYVDFHIYNNLFAGGSRFWLDDGANAAGFPSYVTNGLAMNYNVARSPAGSWGRLSGGSTYAAPSDWNTAFGLDANSQIVSADQFVNGAGGNYRLNTGVASLTAGNTGGVAGGGSSTAVGCYVTGSEEIGLEAAYQ